MHVLPEKLATQDWLTLLTSKRGQNDSKEMDLQKSQSLSTQGFVMNGNSEAVPLEGP